LLKTRKVDGPQESVILPPALLPDAQLYVFENGRLRPQSKKLAEGVVAGSLNDPSIKSYAVSPAEDDLLSRLTVDLCQGGFVLSVSDNVTLATPIEVVFAASGETETHLRLSIALGKNASATVIERHAGQGAFTKTVRSDITLGEGARLNHYRLQDASSEAVVLATGTATLGKDSTYESFSCTMGARLSRHQVKVVLATPGATVHLNGAHILSGESHADTSTLIDHAAPHCTSRETYRQVIGDSARGVFQGKILVREEAQKTDGFQMNQALLLSPHAEVNGKPELEIYADDVKCSHGATVGQLDQTALFYLRSRGIPSEQAKGMLIEAFIGSALDLIETETVRNAFKALVTERLAGGTL
jgi:Fe-S cluster assembly protein SufD